MARKRVESKGVFSSLLSLLVFAVTSMSGGCPWIHGWDVYGVALHGMVLRLLCMMMIDALRCAGVGYLPGMIILCASLRLCCECSGHFYGR